jgi:branched-chain amino acid transport system permease protein
VKLRFNYYLSSKSIKNGLSIIIFLFLVVLPLFVPGEYPKHLLIMVFIAAALGMSFSLLYSTGLITLGASAFYAIGAYASTIFTMQLSFSYWTSLPLVIILTAIIALALGAIIVQKPGISFIIITLLFANVIHQLTGQVGFFGGWGGIVGIRPPKGIGPIIFHNKLTFYYLMLFFLFIITFCFYALYTSRIGRAWNAIKLSPALAETVGINLFRYRLLAFVIASCAASLVGSFYSHYFAAITPDSFGVHTSIYIQLYAILGGLEFYLLGPAIGSLVVVRAPEILRFIKEFEPIVTGLILVIIVLFLPGGIVGTMLRLPSFSKETLLKRFSMYLSKLSDGKPRSYKR